MSALPPSRVQPVDVTAARPPILYVCEHVSASVLELALDMMIEAAARGERCPVRLCPLHKRPPVFPAE